MPPVSPNTTNTTNTLGGTNNLYRFYNVQKEDKSGRNSAVSTVGKVADGAVKTTGTALQASGTAVRGAGIGIQAAGSATKGVGMGVSAVGMGLSATGVGAVAGAPITAVGRVIGVGGSAIKTGGKITSSAGKVISKSGSAIKRTSDKIKQSSKRLVSVAKFTPQGRIIKWVIISWFFVLFVLQFFLALISLGFLAISAGLSLGANYFEVIGTFIGWILDAFQSVSGVNLNVAEHSASIFVFFHTLAMYIGILSLLLAGLISILMLKSPFWGDMAPIKIGVFLASIMGLAIPIANLLPWAVIWMWTIDSLDT